MRLVLRRVLWILLFNGEVAVLFGGIDCGTIGLLGDICVSNSTWSLLLSTWLRTLSADLSLSGWCLSWTWISCFKSVMNELLETI